jgi:alkylresorcinol/alkylpyrone synthase
VVLVSSTGLANPTLDVRLAPGLGLSPGVRRLPLWGLGCGGGAQGLSIAADLARSRPRARVLLCLVELCSLTFVPGDLTPGNLVAAALFGDGAAAAVVEAGELSQEKAGVDLLDCEAARIEESLDVMGWTIADDGWRVVFSQAIPELVRTHAPLATAALLGRHQLSVGAIARHVLHPGGPAVLDAYEAALEIPHSATAAAREALAEYGNCSSVSIFQTMERALGERLERAEDGETVLFSAFGPGFSAEVLLGRVAKP